MSGRANLVITLTAVLAVACGGLVTWRIVADDSEPPPATATPPAEAPAPVGETETSPPAPEQGLALEPPAGAYPVVWVRKGQEVQIRTEPGGGRVVARAGKRTEFSSATVFGVVRRSGDWAGVTTAALPNNQLGWIKLDPERLNAGWTRVAIVIDLSARSAELRAAGGTVRTFPVTIGMPGADTPTGRFAVTDTFRGDLNPAYGCCAVAISATQPNVPSGWIGGRRIAIHGTDGPLGIAASHGCVRAADADVSKLVERMPLGAPVFIRA